MRIDLAGLTFRGDAAPALFTVESDGVSGWFESVDIRRDDSDRPLSHGSTYAPTFRTGRRVSWTGLILTKSASEQDRAMAQLRGMLSDGQSGRLTVENAGTLRWSDVVLNGAPTVRMVVYGRIARYRVEVWARDPRMYGELHTFAAAASVAIFHRGNTNAIPRLIVPNGAASYSITSPGGTLTVTGATSGGTHEIDLRRGRVYRDGVRMPGVLSGPLWTLPSGARWVVSISSGTVGAEVLDTDM